MCTMSSLQGSHCGLKPLRTNEIGVKKAPTDVGYGKDKGRVKGL